MPKRVGLMPVVRVTAGNFWRYTTLWFSATMPRHCLRGHVEFYMAARNGSVSDPGAVLLSRSPGAQLRPARWKCVGRCGDRKRIAGSLSRRALHGCKRKHYQHRRAPRPRRVPKNRHPSRRSARQRGRTGILAAIPTRSRARWKPRLRRAAGRGGGTPARPRSTGRSSGTFLTAAARICGTGASARRPPPRSTSDRARR